MKEPEPLKPCPHCGGPAGLFANYSYRTRGYFVFVKCDICGAQGRICRSENDPQLENWESEACNKAAAAWNMRTGADAKDV